MVQLAVAADLAEAEAIESMLDSAGIAWEVEQAVEHHPTGLDDAPQRVLVPEDELDQALNAIEALSDPEDILGSD